jgi:hypothetical protein
VTDRLSDVSAEALEVRPGSVSSSPDPTEEEEELSSVGLEGCKQEYWWTRVITRLCPRAVEDDM